MNELIKPAKTKQLHGRFGTELTSFLDFLKTASATYEGSEIEVDDRIIDNSETRFNYILNVSEYKSSLEKRYTNSIIELEETLSETYSKFDKLFFITRLLTELETLKHLLVNEPDGSFAHLNFYFSNISKEDKFKEKNLDELHFQNYYCWINFYLEKTHSFILNLKEVIANTSQNEFALPKSMIPHRNASTTEKPLEFFEFLIKRNGIYFLLENFKPTELDELNGIEFDLKTETKIDLYPDPEDTSDGKYKFDDYYYKYIYKEYHVSCFLIDKHIDELKEESEISLFIKLSLTRLNYLLEAVDHYQYKKKRTTDKPIIWLINYFNNKYSCFIPEELKSSRKDKIEPPKQRIESNLKDKIYSFKWAGNEDSFITKSTLLCQSLKKFEFINKATDLGHFSKAFDGSENEHPLKIKWILKAVKNKTTNKKVLCYLIRKLIEMNLIIDDNETKPIQIGFIFCDDKEKSLGDFTPNYSTAYKGGLTKDKKNIDQIIQFLVQSNCQKLSNVIP